MAQRRRQRPGLEHLLLVALTGWGQEQDRRRAQEAGFDRHRVKPVGPQSLHRLLTHPRLTGPQATAWAKAVASPPAQSCGG